ncbi:MAG: Omp28-related outer membrane protein, partial [Alistipes sp.]
SSGLTADDKFGIHNNVVRQVAGRLSDYDFSGEELGTLAAGATATRILQIPVDTKWVMENCKVIVFVSTPDKAQAEKYYVNNAILCNLGAATAFEYK